MKGGKKTLKLIFLSLTLLVPVAIYLFLRFFGHNQFNIPIGLQCPAAINDS